MLSWGASQLPVRRADSSGRLLPAAVGRGGLASPCEDGAGEVLGARFCSRAGSRPAFSWLPRGLLVVTGATPARQRRL